MGKHRYREYQQPHKIHPRENMVLCLSNVLVSERRFFQGIGAICEFHQFVHYTDSFHLIRHLLFRFIFKRHRPFHRCPHFLGFLDGIRYFIHKIQFDHLQWADIPLQ
jgi:hypothetical protein